MCYSNTRITQLMNCSKRMRASPVLADREGMICTRSRKEKRWENCESSRKPDGSRARRTIRPARNPFAREGCYWRTASRETDKDLETT